MTSTNPSAQWQPGRNYLVSFENWSDQVKVTPETKALLEKILLGKLGGDTDEGESFRQGLMGIAGANYSFARLGLQGRAYFENPDGVFYIESKGTDIGGGVLSAYDVFVYVRGLGVSQFRDAPSPGAYHAKMSLKIRGLPVEPSHIEGHHSHIDLH